MGSKCSSCFRGSVKDTAKTSADLQNQATGETRDVSKPEPQSPTLTPSQVLERSSVAPTESHGETSNTREAPCYRASDLLWSTGSFSDLIPDGFHFVVPDNRLKHFESIPTLDELRALREEGVDADVILVDFKKDRKLDLLKRFVNSLVGGPRPNPVKVIKKIAGVVSDVEKQSLQSPTNATESFGSHGFPLLGKIKTVSCRVRAIWFKLLADTVGLQSKLVVGFTSDPEISESDESYTHMSVVVTVNTVEMVVDLTRSNFQLIPMSSNALYMAHASASGGGSCHSPLGSSSPMYSYMDRVDHGSPQDLNVRAGEGSMLRKRLSATPDLIESHDDDLQRNSSPQNNQSQSPEKSEPLDQSVSQIWNEVMGSLMFQGKPLLPNEEWNIDFSELEVGTFVGMGGSAKVFRGVWNGKDVAIKMFRDQDATAENIKDFCNEISILSRLQHPNVVKFLGGCTKPPRLSLVTEYVGKGSMYDLLYSTDEIKNLSWQTKLNMLRDICRGLMCVHQMGIVHRDLKSANCLLTDEWTVKICDFGLSRILDGSTINYTVPAGTSEWIAPEVIRNEPLTEKCDIFSFGVVVWELCTLSKPWDGVPKDKVIYAVGNEGARLEIPEGPLGKLIADCWSEPEQRPSCQEILTYLATCEDSLC